MKRYLLTILISAGVCLTGWAQLPMEGWKLHTAYNNVTRIEDGGEKIFALSEGSLFSVDKETHEIEYYTRLNGLTSTDIADIKYDATREQLVIMYRNGYIDLMHGNEITNIPDLYNTQLSISKEVNHIMIHQGLAYMAMDFGIVVVNLTRGEIADTYYIGKDAQTIDVLGTTVLGDSLFAISPKSIYSAALKDNLVDYSYWRQRTLPRTGTPKQIVTYNHQLVLLCDSTLLHRDGTTWTSPFPSQAFYLLRVSDGHLLALSPDGAYDIQTDYTTKHCPYYVNAPDMLYDSQTGAYWYAYYADGVAYWHPTNEEINNFLPSGPLTNTAYRMRFQGKKLAVVPGGYLGVYYNRAGAAMAYEEGHWTNFTQDYMQQHIGKYTEDYSDMIIDPQDPTHFFIASFGYGLIEFRDNAFYKRYMPDNSPLISRIPTKPEKYTWVDALAYDPQGNLWMMNPSEVSIRVLTPTGEWHGIENKACKGLVRVKDLLISPKTPNIKVVIGTYNTIGIGIFDDRGTISNQADDRAASWNSFVDEDGNTILPEILPCAAFDQKNALWVGTKNGVLKFPNPESLFTSNACTRIKIAREDGSGLADYMLNDEQINAIAVDGANRIWFGTENSGAYLMDLSDPQNIVTVHHYTIDNSPLPSNTIISIAINPITGEVFFGTGGGLVSYQSDAAEGKEDYSGAYAYPNPVRENFDGVITIAGLMDDTQVRITDNGGNLVYETKSNGGIAIWDGRNGQGERVSSGVYFAMCVTADGENKTLVKILVMN